MSPAHPGKDGSVTVVPVRPASPVLVTTMCQVNAVPRGARATEAKASSDDVTRTVLVIDTPAGGVVGNTRPASMLRSMNAATVTPSAGTTGTKRGSVPDTRSNSAV